MKREQLRKMLSKRVLVLDGAMGTELIKRGCGDATPEKVILHSPEVILKIQSDYVKAGSDIILTATFGANRLKLKKLGLETRFEELNRSAVTLAKKALSKGVLVAGDIGPTGDMFPPSGELDFTKTYKCFKEQTGILAEEGVDLFILETFSDIRELKAAILAVSENAPDKFIIANLTFEKGGRTLIGTDPTGFALAFEDLNVDALGVNCSLGPEGIFPIFQELSRTTSKLLSIEPNAGIPEIIDGKAHYRMSPEKFVRYAEDFLEMGANIIGGCCGTGPEHIRLLVKKIKKRRPRKRKNRSLIGVSSLTKNVIFVPDTPTIIIGERINPTGRKRMTGEIEKGVMKAILTEAKKQSKEGASLLDINLGMESRIREDWLRRLVTELLISPGLPLSVDIRSVRLIERAFQEYAGRPLLNSITLTGMEGECRLLKRYGGMVVFLPIDKNGVPETAKKRLQLTKKAIDILKEMGIDKDRILFDPIVMSLATGNDPLVTLKTLESYKSLGLHTIIGLSNISFGLPHRRSINKYFLDRCIEIGLDAVIMNPLDRKTSAELNLSPVFSGKKTIMEFLKETKITRKEKPKKKKKELNVLNIIIEGEKEKILTLIKKMLKDMDYRRVIEDVLKPALEEVGELYEKKNIFLPQLILAAETAQAAFGFIEKRFSEKKGGEGKVVIATVRGDIHDIGKNIVAMMLKNAGFEVIDLGKDVPSEIIVKSAEKKNAKIIALSALMTTTALRMKEVINIVEKNKMPAKVIVGGACVTKKFADEIGANAYAKDATEAVKEVKKLVETPSQNI